MKTLPLVSIIIPCRNEKRFIEKCLDSILANEYPKDRLEVLIVDGMSEDGTRAVVENYTRRYSFIKLLDNPKRIIPSAMNIGIHYSAGELIMKMDAHSTYPKDYISKTVWYLNEYQVDNVGGILKIMPNNGGVISKAIPLVLSHPFGSGNAYIKIGLKHPQWADTAAFGCYKISVFQKVGLFNEKLARSSDMDLNKRLRKAGGKILLVPDIVINYYADPNLKAFWKHNFADGVWATYVLKFKNKAFSWRHWIPLAFVLSLICSAVLSAIFSWFFWVFFSITSAYALANLGASWHLAIRERYFPYLWALPIVFASRHITHGLGALWGFVLILKPDESWKEQ